MNFNINDKEIIQMEEHVYANGKLVSSYVNDEIVGIVKTSCFSGNELISKGKYKNKLLVSGRVYLCEKAINTRSNFKPPSIDQDYGVSGVLTLNNTNLIQEDIIGIMVGIGGTTAVYGTINDVEVHKKTVPNPVPFRIVPLANDLTGEERAKYFLRVVEGGNVKYYGKKFESRSTKVLYENGTEVPLNVDSIASPGNIRVFNEYLAVVGQKDIREYFLSVYGDTSLCQINTVGLLTGYPETVNGQIEYRNVRCITTANMAQNPLKDELSVINFSYEQLFK